MASYTRLINREEALRRVGADRIEPIQEVVEVDYDNALQTPLAFRRLGASHEVLEVLGKYRERPDDLSVDYLLRTDRGVYLLYLDVLEPSAYVPRQRARWVLSFRVEDEADELEEAKGKKPMLMDYPCGGLSGLVLRQMAQSGDFQFGQGPPSTPMTSHTMPSADFTPGWRLLLASGDSQRAAIRVSAPYLSACGIAYHPPVTL